MTETSGPGTLVDAFALACSIHAGDVRKGTTIPYISHLLGVCAMVLADGGDEEEAMAALLHDALEDHPQEISAEGLEARFGLRVRALVEAATDTPSDYSGGEKSPWLQRKTDYINHVRNARPSDLRVSLADKLYNARAIASDLRVHGIQVWDRFNASKPEILWYYRSLVSAFRDAGVVGVMLGDLDLVVTELEKQ